ncbi:hypothetical protein QBC47DRAFT_418723 [Echria macrotheca]|uniref:Uncharacterized protein n=1 Tax=Echria macrotheca TaxID=438768 RepID=A0AAJ0B2K2_9PEZI|nr:hypothetical protein QBC47DRAFT_418723 [Echria macrotheca]
MSVLLALSLGREAVVVEVVADTVEAVEADTVEAVEAPEVVDEVEAEAETGEEAAETTEAVEAEEVGAVRGAAVVVIAEEEPETVVEADRVLVTAVNEVVIPASRAIRAATQASGVASPVTPDTEARQETQVNGATKVVTRVSKVAAQVNGVIQTSGVPVPDLSLSSRAMMVMILEITMMSLSQMSQLMETTRTATRIRKSIPRCEV